MLTLIIDGRVSAAGTKDKRARAEGRYIRTEGRPSRGEDRCTRATAEGHRTRTGSRRIDTTI